MIEVILVCALAMEFTVPAEWTVKKIEPGASTIYTLCTTIPCGNSGERPTRATLSRVVKAGDAVKIPRECDEATATSKTSGSIIFTR